MPESLSDMVHKSTEIGRNRQISLPTDNILNTLALVQL
jgi:hypothetical protein